MADKLDSLTPYFVRRFRRAAIVYDFGLEDERYNMQRAGGESLTESLTMLDTYGEPRRLSLLPLLDDSEPGARVYAAKYLMDLAPDRALATLKDVAVHGRANAQITAMSLLADHFEREQKR